MSVRRRILFFTDDEGGHPGALVTLVGSIVSFIAKKVTQINELKVDINPVQSGSGDPSPTNIRSITGKTELAIRCTGRNVNYFGGAIRSSNKSYYFVFNNGTTDYGWYNMPPNTTAYFTVNITTSNTVSWRPYYQFSGGSDTTVGSYSTSNTRQFTITNSSDIFKTVRVWLYSNSGNFDGATVTSMMTFDEYADYEPYQGDVYSISWATEAGTVYGGTLDVISGKLTVDRVSVDMGTLTWAYDNTAKLFRVTYSNMPFAVKKIYGGGQSKALCSCYKTYTGDVMANMPDKNIMVGNSYMSGTNAVFVKDSNYTKAASFKTSVSGQTLVYEVETPTEYNFTPEEVSTLKGENNIWADTGDVTVTAAGITEITPSSAQALNMLLGGMYTNNHTADDVSDDEALNIILGGSNA